MLLKYSTRLIKGSTRDEPWSIEILKKGLKYSRRLLKKRCKYSTSFEL
jgi:hypothetical protein